LLDKGANPNVIIEGLTAVQSASRDIHPGEKEANAKIRQCIALLKNRGAAIDLFSAVAVGDEQEVDRLLKRDPKSANSRSDEGYPALHFAIGMNDKNIVDELLKAGCDVDIRNKCTHTGDLDETPLGCAAFWGRYEIAKLLIGRGANVNALTSR